MRSALLLLAFALPLILGATLTGDSSTTFTSSAPDRFTIVVTTFNDAPLILKLNTMTGATWEFITAMNTNTSAKAHSWVPIRQFAAPLENKDHE